MITPNGGMILVANNPISDRPEISLYLSVLHLRDKDVRRQAGDVVWKKQKEKNSRPRQVFTLASSGEKERKLNNNNNNGWMGQKKNEKTRWCSLVN